MNADVLTAETADLRTLFGLPPEHDRGDARIGVRRHAVVRRRVRRPVDWTLQQRQFFQNTML